MSQGRIRKHEPAAKRAKNKLAAQTKLTGAEVHRALIAASKAIDRLGAENAGLRRIIVAERAQVIYYTEQALAFAQRKTLDLVLQGFDELADERREEYVKRAIIELEDKAEPAAAAKDESQVKPVQ